MSCEKEGDGGGMRVEVSVERKRCGVCKGGARENRREEEGRLEGLSERHSKSEMSKEFWREDSMG